MSDPLDIPIDASRLWTRHVVMAEIGATPNGGVTREALTPEDNRARAVLIGWARARGFGCAIDRIGNLFIRRPGRDPDAAPVVTGSHIDSQPRGGRFDGTYGVLAGLEALEAIDEAAVETRRPLEVAVWTNEEGTRFLHPVMGSEVFVHPERLDDMLALEDDRGVSVAAALAATRASLPALPERPFDRTAAAYVEAHIEQGPILEETGKTIGIVTGIQGGRRFRVDVRGEAGHAGTLPHKNRKDALLAAVAMIAELRELMRDPEDIVRFTVGRFSVSPNASAVVPDHASFTIDFRHPDEACLSRLGDQIEPVCRANAGPCDVAVAETGRKAPVQFDGIVPEAILAASEALQVPYMTIHSGAGHDAQNLCKICPAGMIFVPCEKGISHNEAESAKPEDLAAGAQVLARTLAALAER